MRAFGRGRFAASKSHLQIPQGRKSAASEPSAAHLRRSLRWRGAGGALAVQLGVDRGQRLKRGVVADGRAEDDLEEHGRSGLKSLEIELRNPPELGWRRKGPFVQGG